MRIVCVALNVGCIVMSIEVIKAEWRCREGGGNSQSTVPVAGGIIAV